MYIMELKPRLRSDSNPPLFCFLIWFVLISGYTYQVRKRKVTYKYSRQYAEHVTFNIKLVWVRAFTVGMTYAIRW